MLQNKTRHKENKEMSSESTKLVADTLYIIYSIMDNRLRQSAFTVLYVAIGLMRRA
jgi:hypothetical protein